MRQEFYNEEKQLFQDFVDRYYFQFWNSDSKLVDRYNRSLELYPTASCNTNCTYCYLKNFGGETFYDKESQKPSNVINNTKKILDYFLEKDMMPPNIEIFSGDIFSIENLWKQYFDLIIDFLEKSGRANETSIMIPTNGTWALDSDKIEEIEKYLNKIEELGARPVLSISIDGGPVDDYSRPFKAKGKKYTKELYDRLFDIGRRRGFQMHPMLSSKNVYDWNENFKWFLNKWMEQGFTAKQAIKRTYILEVRNPDWTPEDLAALRDFVFTTGRYIFNEVYQGDMKEFISNVIGNKVTNFFGSGFGYIGRGMPCSIETTFSVRSDLKIISCHRLGFEGYEGGQFVDDGNGSLEIEPINPMSFMASRFTDQSKNFMCSNCGIKYICGGYCLGANYEMTGEQYVPVPSVCRMEHVKHQALGDLYKELGVLDYIINKFNSSSYINKRQIENYKYLLNSKHVDSESWRSKNE